MLKLQNFNKIIALLISLSLISSIALGRNNIQDPSVGFNLSFIFNISSHQNQYGIKLNTYVLFKNIQVNTESIYSFYSFTLGKRKNVLESTNSIGIVGIWGKEKKDVDFELSPTTNQGNKNVSVGYAYIFYKDNVQTSQNSGAISFHYKQFGITHENDFFAGKGRDRYRTAKMRLSFQDSLLKYQTGFNLWTGETKGTDWIKKKTKKCPNGYKNLFNMPYGRTSHGIVYFGINGFILDRSIGNIKIGWDSEEIRHVIQNRFMHDLPFIPKSIARKTPHYPRLNANGFPIFNKDEARKSCFYYEFGWNNN